MREFNCRHCGNRWQEDHNFTTCPICGNGFFKPKQRPYKDIVIRYSGCPSGPSPTQVIEAKDIQVLEVTGRNGEEQKVLFTGNNFSEDNWKKRGGKEAENRHFHRN